MPFNVPKVWSDDQVSMLTQNWNNLEISVQELAVRLGVDELGVVFTPRHIWTKAKKLGFHRRGWASNGGPWTPEKTKLLAQYWDEGHSAGEIGKLLGMTRNAVIGKKNRAGLASRKPKIQAACAAVARSKKVSDAKEKVRQPPTFVPIQEPALDPNNPGVLIHQLKWNGRPSSCRAIIKSSPKGPLYCGENCSPDQSYCMGHCKIFLNGYIPPRIMAAE